ncbi:MAG: PorV/PorQ family protein [bacterium]
MKNTLKFLLLLFTASSIMAQSAGTSGLSFLKMGFGARNIAMGDLGVVTATDASALNYNPALLGKFTNSQIMITHNEWIQDVRSEQLGASFSLFNIPFAVGINTTSISDIEVRTKPGEPLTTFNAHYFYGSLSTGFETVENLFFGMTIKYLYEGMYSDESTGIGYDFGLLYENVINGLNLGASIKNLGSMDVLRGEETKLPVDLRAAAAYNFTLESINSKIVALGGIQKYTSTDDLHIHTGAEILYNDLLALRLGYLTGYDSRGLTSGLGILWNSISFDYAFTPFSYDLGSSHTISLMYTF